MGETIPSVLAGKHLHEKNPTRSMLEAYNKTPIFITVEVMEDVVELVVRKLLGGLDPRGTDSEALQGWILKFREERKKSY